LQIPEISRAERACLGRLTSNLSETVVRVASERGTGMDKIYAEEENKKYRAKIHGLVSLFESGQAIITVSYESQSK
jgi:hypothetical protein